MSAFYRCDWEGCEAEAEHPGVDFSMDEVARPEGWRGGPLGDYCPVHSTGLELAPGQWTYVQLGARYGGEQFVEVLACREANGTRWYPIRHVDTEAEPSKTHHLTRPAERVEAYALGRGGATYLSWVPRGKGRELPDSAAEHERWCNRQ